MLDVWEGIRLKLAFACVIVRWDRYCGEAWYENERWKERKGCIKNKIEMDKSDITC